MLSLILAMTTPPGADTALALCRPALARKAEGEIATISIASSEVHRSERVIRGELTAYLGRQIAGPGTAVPHHLIRATFDYGCWVKSGRVRKTTLKQPQSGN